MKVAARYEITKIRVNPAGEKLEELEINHEAVDLGKTVQDNKEATIDVSSYSEPVEVTPSSGKTSMKKVTVTLDNIPSGSSNILYAWSYTEEGGDVVVYTITETPSTSDKVYEMGASLDYNGISGSTITAVTETTIEFSGNIYTRSSTYDINPLWR